MISKEELSWQAGIMEGEGTITIARSPRKNRPSYIFKAQIDVGNTDLRLILPFKESWGGYIYCHKDPRKEKKWKDIFAWHCPVNTATIFLSSLLPYMKAKHEVTKVVLEFLDYRSLFKHRFLRGGGKCGLRGSAPLSDEEVKRREYFWNKARSLNPKGQYARSLLNLKEK